MNTSMLRILAAVSVFSASVAPIQAHNLDTIATSISFASDYVETMSQRATLQNPLIQQGDEFWVLLKTTAGPGTATGVGGYQTFYVPPGVEVLDAAYVFPDASDPRGFRNIPMKGQSPIAIGSGSVGAASTPELIGWDLPGMTDPNFRPVTATGVDRGTIAGVYADTGIFFSTDPRTAFNSYGMPKPPLTGPPFPMKNNSGDTVGEWFAANINNSEQRNILGVMNLWDSYQLRAYGRGDVSPLIDNNGRGNAPWGLANVVAGPQSGYAWEFDYEAYAAHLTANPGDTAGAIRAAIKIGPWNRVQYPGSQISQDVPGSPSNVLGQVGIDASLMGIDPTTIPADATAIRFAIGQLELGRPEFSAVKVRIKITDNPAEPLDCGNFKMHADAFGGDAGGTSGGKDHMWRYFDPTVVTLTPCTLLQKVASKSLVAPGETFYFDITFANTGTFALPNVTITDTLPSGLVHVSAIPAPTTLASPNFTWNVGTVQPGGLVTIRQYVKATGSGTLFNTATARSNGEVIGTAQQSVEVGTRAILQKSKSVTPNATAAGEIVTYTLEIENIGTGPNGAPLRARDALPAGFTYQSFVGATLNGATIASPTITVNATNPTEPVFTVSQSIQPGKKLFITFTALIGPDVQPGTYFNSFQLEYEGKIVPPIPEAPVTVAGGKIGDTVWRDWNGNGVQDAGEEGIPGVTVELYASDGTTLLRTAVTDEDGRYYFPGLVAGTYVVKVTAPADHAQSGDPDVTLDNQHTVSLANDQQYLTADFGYEPVGAGVIGDIVFEDVGNDGLFTSGTDTGISGVSVLLYADTDGDGAVTAGDILIGSTTTNGSGLYSFTGLAEGFDYVVAVDAGDAALATYFGVDPFQSSTEIPQAVSGLSGSYLDADFGFWRVAPGSIGDQVFADADGNGLYHPLIDTPLGGVTVSLERDNVVIATTTTAPDGTYLFGNLGPGNYTVTVDSGSAGVPAGFAPSVSGHSVALAVGQNFLDADFPFTPLIGKAVDKAFAAPGDILNYTINLNSLSSDLLGNVVVSDTVPLGTTFSTVGQGGSLENGITENTPGIPGSDPGSPASGSVTLIAAKDTSINADSPSLNYGASTSLTENRAGGDTLGSKQVLVQFDLSAIPSGATLTGAEFRLTKSDALNPNTTFQIYPLLKSWDEGTGGVGGAAGAASFNLRVAGTYWGGGTTPFDTTAPSADFGSLLAQTTVNGAGTYTWSAAALLTQVQNWYSAPANNFGLVMGSNQGGTDDTVWNSRENAGAKPRLVVNYTAAPTPATTTTITVNPDSVIDTGAGVNATVSMTVTATGAVSNIVPSALTVIPGANGANATLVSGPTGSPASIGSGGGSAVFTWVYQFTAGTQPNEVFFQGTASGTGATFGSATSHGVIVSEPSPPAALITWDLGANIPAVPGSHAGTAPVAGSASLTAVADNEIWSDQPATNYGGDNRMWIERTNTYRNRLLIQFDLSSIPSSATITSAVMTLEQRSGANENNNPAISAHRMLVLWEELTSTWNSRSTGTPWAGAGGEGNYEATAAATTNVTTDAQHNWTLTPLVQSWVNGTNANHGVIMRLPNESVNVEHEFYTREEGTASRRPNLTLNYTTPGTPATTTGIAVNRTLAGSGSQATVSMTVTAAGAVSNIVPSALTVVPGSFGAGASLVSGPVGSPASIGAGGGTATFTWVYSFAAGTQADQIRFSGNATATGATFGSATSHGVIVSPPLTFQVTVNNPPPASGLIHNTAFVEIDGETYPSNTTETATSGSIGDFVWADLNGNGIQDAGEFGLSGVTVLLYAADGVTLLGSDVTDANGNYRFFGLTAGNYVVSYDAGSVSGDYFATTPASLPVSLTTGQQYEDADFGLNQLPSGTGSIGDYVWIDANNDGVQDAGEAALPGVGVILERLINGNWVAVASTVTDTNGAYSFTGLSAGNFRVTVDTGSLISSPYAQGTFALGDVMAPTFDRDGTGTPHVALVTLATDSTVIDTTDFGYNWSGSIGDFVWWDYNTNGLQDEAPLVGIVNARVQLYFDKDFDGVFDRILGDYEILRVFTDANGNYHIPNLPPGNYFVDVYEDSITTTGVRNIVPTTDDIIPVILEPGNMNVDTADFGYYEGARVEALVFWDENGNGIRDSGEVLLAGITVTLTGFDTFGNPVTQTVTSSNAGYVVFLVPEGEYTISYDVAEVNSLYPALGTQTTVTSFEFFATAGEDGVRFFDFGVDNTGAIGDTIFADLDGTSGEGVGQGSGDPGLAGVTVNLYLDVDGDGIIDFGAGDLLLATTLTDAQGNYLFTGLPDTVDDQRYVIEVLGSTIPAAYLSTASSYPTGADSVNSTFSTTLLNGEAVLTADFGYPLVPDVYYALSGTIYDDNGDGVGGIASNGIQDGDEPGIAGVRVVVQIDTNNDGTYDQTYVVFTDANGFYSVGGLLEGSDVRITVDESTLSSTAYVQTGDPNGAPLSNVWNITDIQANADDLNFGYVETLGSIAGTIVIGNGNGSADPGEPTLEGVTVTATYSGPDGIPGNGDDEVFTTTTDANGNYSFIGLLPGTYVITTDIPTGFHEYADADGFNPNSIDITLAVGADVTGRDFEYQSASLSGYVWTDTNADAIRGGSEPVLENITVFLDLDGNGALDPGEPSTVTNASGYYEFTGLDSGSHNVRVDPTGLPAGSFASYDIDGIGTPNLGVVTLVPNEDRTGVDFGYYLHGSITGSVFTETSNEPIPDVTLSLLDAAGAPVLDGMGAPITTVTALDGSYSFTGVRPGSYRVLETQPDGYYSISDKDGGDKDLIGDVTLIAVVSGQANTGNNFIEEVSTCTPTWAAWKQLHPGQEADGNPDGDAYDNLNEFAFAMEAYSGAGDTFHIQPSEDPLAPGTIDAVFIRPTMATLNVTYYLEYASVVGNSMVWTSIAITPAMYDTEPAGFCKEKITIKNLELITGLDGKGVVRIRTELDEENDGVIDHTSFTEVEGWKETPFGICCQTYGVPYLRDTEFTGTVDANGVSGNTVTFANSAGTVDLATLLAPGVAYFMEITSGLQEGQRFDIVSASGATVTLTADNSLNSHLPPFNTLVGSVPSNIANSTVVIRRHWTLGEIFPAEGFGSSTVPSLADQIQIFSGGVWTLIHLFDDNGTPRWVDNFNNLVDQAGLVIQPGQGVFLNNRNEAQTLLSYGEIRVNDFVRPLAPGSSLVSGGYPINQSAAGAGSRDMWFSNGFIGTKDFKTADSFFIWKGDTTPGLSTYDTYYLLNGAPQSPTLLRWVKVGDATATNRAAEILLLENRAVFTRTATGLPTYGYPAPWTP